MSNTTQKFNELKRSGYKGFGYENGWKEEPHEVHIHKSVTHETHTVNDNHGDHIYWCDECKIFWLMDSSD